MSKDHLQVVLREKVFGNRSIEYALVQQLEINQRQHNEREDKIGYY